MNRTEKVLVAIDLRNGVEPETIKRQLYKIPNREFFWF